MVKKYTKNGEEILDDTPVEVPVRFRNRPMTTVEEAMRALAFASEVAAREGHETFEESMDFGEDEESFGGPADFSEMDEREVLEFMRAAEEELKQRKQREGQDTFTSAVQKEVEKQTNKSDGKDGKTDG